MSKITIRCRRNRKKINCRSVVLAQENWLWANGIVDFGGRLRARVADKNVPKLELRQWSKSETVNSSSAPKLGKGKKGLPSFT